MSCFTAVGGPPRPFGISGLHLQRGLLAKKRRFTRFKPPFSLEVFKLSPQKKKGVTRWSGMWLWQDMDLKSGNPPGPKGTWKVSFCCFCWRVFLEWTTCFFSKTWILIPIKFQVSWVVFRGLYGVRILSSPSERDFVWVWWNHCKVLCIDTFGWFILVLPCCHTCSQEDFAFVQYLETLLMLEVLTSSFPVPYHDDFDMFLGPNSCTFRMRGKKSHDL